MGFCGAGVLDGVIECHGVVECCLMDVAGSANGLAFQRIDEWVG